MSAPAASTVMRLPDAAAVEAAGRSFRLVAGRFDDAVTDVTATWQGLSAPGVYETPDTAAALAAMQGPRRLSTVFAEQCRRIERAFADLAATLSALASQRALLLQDIDARTRAESAPAPEDPDDAARAARAGHEADAALAGRIDAFNAAAMEADQTCAAALRALARYPLAQTEQFVDQVARGGDLIAAGELLSNRTRRLLVPRAGAVLPDPDPLPEPDLRWRGADYAFDADRGLLLPQGLVHELPPYDPATRPHVRLVPAESIAETATPQVARVLGKGLGAAGVVLTYASTYADADREFAAAHPEWSAEEHQARTIETTAVVGTASAGGAWAGAIAGAEIGAAIGSVVPGPGTLIGGILGGVLGGLLGGQAGQEVGEGVEDAVHPDGS